MNHDEFIADYIHKYGGTQDAAEAAWVKYQALSTGTSSTDKDLPVYWGPGATTSKTTPQPNVMVKNTSPEWTTRGLPTPAIVAKNTPPEWATRTTADTTKLQSQAYAYLDDLMLSDPVAYGKIKQQMLDANLGLSATATPFEIDNAWKAIVDKAAQYYNGANKKKMSPFDVLDMYSQEAAKAGAGSSSSTTYITQSSPADIQARYQAIGQQMIGQNPDASEAPVGAVNAAEAANPSVVTQDQATGTQTTSGGLDQGAIDKILTDRAKQNPNYGAYQAVATYYPALKAILGPAVSTGSNG